MHQTWTGQVNQHPWAVMLSWLGNAYSHPFLVGNFDPQSTPDWSSFWCAIRVH